MKKLLLLLSINLVCLSQSVFTCIDGPREINTRTSWDWYRNKPRGPSWNLKYINTNAQIITQDVASPFFNSSNKNLEHLSIYNPSGFRDYLQVDGWELINYGFSTNPLYPPSPEGPIILLYNKFTAKMRVFWLLSQIYSAFKRADGSNKPAFINLKLNSGLTRFNVLTHNSSPLKALNEVPYEIGTDGKPINEIYSYANSPINQVPQWFYADFQMAYDPCVCHNDKGGRFELQLGANESANINFTLEALPPPISGSGTSANTNAGNQKGLTLKQIGDKIKEGVTAFKSQSDAVNNMNEYVKKLFPVGSKKYEDSKFLEGFNVVGKIAKAIPIVGEVASATLGVFDFITGVFNGVEEPIDKGTPSNTPVVIMNNFKASGTISSISDIATASIPIPGSTSVIDTNEYKILYNNPLGVFNLLEKPRVEEFSYTYTKFDDLIYNQYYTETRIPASVCGKVFQLNSQRLCSSNWNEIKDYIYTNTPNTQDKKITDYTIERRYFKLKNELKFVLNPVIGFELDNSNIKASIEIQDCNESVSGAVNTQYYGSNLTNLNTNPFESGHFVSKFYDISCLNNTIVYVDIPKIRNTNIIYPTQVANGYALTYSRRTNNSNLDYCINPKVFVKIAAVFRKTLPDGTKIEVPWIGKFECSKIYPKTTINAFLPPTAEDLQGDINIDSPLNITTNTTMTASNSITINANITVATGVTLTLQAPVIYKNNAILTGSVIETSDMGAYANTIVCNKGITPQTAAQIETFCKGNLAGQYKPASRRLEEDLLQTDLVIENISLKITPNPVQNKATIHYELSQNSSSVNLTVYDAMGNTVLEVLKNEIVAAGVFKYELTEGILPNGLYIVRLTTETESKSVKMIVE